MKPLLILHLLLIGFVSTAQNSAGTNTPDFKDCSIIPTLLKSAMTEFKDHRGSEMIDDKPSFASNANRLLLATPHAKESYLEYKVKNWECHIKYVFTTEKEMIARRSQFEKSLDRCLGDYVKEKKDEKAIHYKHKDFPGSASFAHNLKNPMIWSFSGGRNTHWYFNITIKAPSVLTISKTDVSVGNRSYKHKNGFATVWVKEDSTVTGIYYQSFPEKRQLIPKDKNGRYTYDWDGTDYDLSFTGDSMWLTIDHPEYGVLVDRARHITTLTEKSNQRNYIRGSATSGSDGFRISLYRDTIVVERFLIANFYGKVEENNHISINEKGFYDNYYAIVGDEVWVNREDDWRNPVVFTLVKEE